MAFMNNLLKDFEHSVTNRNNLVEYRAVIKHASMYMHGNNNENENDNENLQNMDINNNDNNNFGLGNINNSRQ